MKVGLLINKLKDFNSEVDVVAKDGVIMVGSFPIYASENKEDETKNEELEKNIIKKLFNKLFNK